MTPILSRIDSAAASRVSSLLPLLACAAFTPGAAGSDPLPGELLHVASSAIESISGPITDAAAVHADLDGRLDVIAHVGTELVFVSAPDPKQHSASLGVAGVSAMATVRRVGGGAVAIAAADPFGLEWLVHDPEASRSFAVLRTTIAGAAWAGARSVVAADLDGDGDLDLIGLDATGTQILRLDQLAGETFQERPALSVSAELSRLRVVRWIGGELALAAIERIPGLADDSCVLIDLDGMTFRSTVPGGSIDDIAVISTVGAASEALAVLAEGHVVVLRPGGLEEAPLDVSSVQPSRIAVADVDNDGAGDLLLNSTSVAADTVVWNHHTGGAGSVTYAPLGAGNSMSVDLDLAGVDMSGQACPPLAADFDRDGDVDLMQFVEATRSAAIQRNPMINEVDLRPTVDHVEWLLQSSAPEAAVFLTVPPMPNGSAPDWVEVLLTTVRPGTASSAPEHYRASVFEDLSQSNVGELVYVPVRFAGELGEYVSLSFRCFTEDAATGHLDGVGVESPYGFVETTPVEGDGTDNGYEGGIINQNDPNGTPPPPPPKPIDI